MNNEQQAFYEQTLHQLQTNGVKLTTQRRSILGVVMEFHHPFTAEQLLSKLTARSAKVHRAAMYRDLSKFVEQGILVELNVLGSEATYYEPTSQEHHHHFFCQVCQTLLDVRPSEVEEALHKFEAQLTATGYHTEFHKLKFYGKCPHCAHQAGE